jgi:hypothetical protein
MLQLTMHATAQRTAITAAGNREERGMQIARIQDRLSRLRCRHDCVGSREQLTPKPKILGDLNGPAAPKRIARGPA